MIDIEKVMVQVKRNCDVSDAKYWGVYSLCGLLLRMRDMYKWEKGIEPWVEMEQLEVMDWINEREKSWKALSAKEFSDIQIGGGEYRPFDSEGINKAIAPEGYVYGAGYGIAMKPSFFLAELEECWRERGYTIYIAGRELARDLSTAPALLQGDCIFGRKMILAQLLWGRIFEIKRNTKMGVMDALEDYGLDRDKVLKNPGSLKDEVDMVVYEELKTYLYHEIGEGKEKDLPDNIWRDIVSTFPNTGVEMFARAVKDLLADTHEEGMLKYITANKRAGSIGFYVSFLDGFRKSMFSEIITAYREFKKTKDWELIENARRIGYDKAKKYAGNLIKIYEKGRTKGDEWTKEEINKELIAPLGF